MTTNKEWEEELKNIFFHPFYSFYNGKVVNPGWEKVDTKDDVPDWYPDGAEVREHLPDEEIERYKDLRDFIKEAISQAIAEERRRIEDEIDLEQLKRYMDDDSKLAHSSYGAGHSYGRWEMANEILEIINHK